MATAVTVPLGPAPVHLSGIRAGDRNEITFALTYNGAPIDLTGLTVTAQARTSATDAVMAIEANVSITDAAAGEGVMAWDGDEVRTLLAGAATWTGVWDLQVGDDGDATTVAAGTFGAVMDVTRP